METKTQKQIILKVLQEAQDWVEGYKLIRTNTNWGYLGPQAGRRCRELVKEGIIHRKQEGKYVFYSIKERPKVEQKYRIEQVGNTAHLYKEEVIPILST